MRTVPGWGLITSAAAPVLLIGGWTLAAALRPEPFDQVRQTISDLAATGAPNRWVMTSALVGVGVAHVATAIALRPASLVSRSLLGVGGVATVLVAVFPLPVSGPAPEHALVAGVAFVALGTWPALSWLRRSTPELVAPTRATADLVSTEPTTREPLNRAAHEPTAVPVPFRPAVALAAAGVLVAGLGWFFIELVQDTGRIGLSERVAAGSQSLWPLIAVILARRSKP